MGFHALSANVRMFVVFFFFYRLGSSFYIIAVRTSDSLH